MLCVSNQPRTGLGAAPTMTYLRMRKSHRTQPGLALEKASAEMSIEIPPVQEIQGTREIQPRVAAVKTKPRRSRVDPAISEGQSRGGSGRIGTLHKPVHAH